MAWTYSALKAADDALPGAPLSLEAALAALSAQTVTSPAMDVQWSAIRDVLMTGFDWGTLVQACQLPLGGTFPGGGTQTAAIQAAALSIRECCLYGGLFKASDATVWGRLTTAAGRLTPAAVGALSAASATAVGLLRTPTVAAWPGLTVRDVWLARGQP